jgi:protein tyrosine kinase modulator
MSQKNTQQNTVLELWELLLRYRWRFILPAFAVTLSILAMSLFLPRKYKSEAMFERRTDMVLTEMTAKGATRNFQEPRNSLVEEIAGSRAVDELITQIEPQLQQTGLLQTELDRQVLRTNIRRSTIVHWDIASGALDRVRVEYINPNPKVAKLVVNGLVSNYIRRTQDAMDKRLNESSDFFKQEVANNRQIIDDLETRLLEFEINNGDLLPASTNSVQERLGARETELQDTVAKRDAAIVRARNLKEAIAETPATVPEKITAPNPELTRLNAKYQKLDEELTQYTDVLKMKAAHPDVIALKQRVDALRSVMDKTDKTIVAQELHKTNPKLAELELQYTQAVGDQEALTRQIEVISDQVSKMSAQTGEMFPVRSGYRKLNRQVQQAQRQLAFWEDNLRRVDMTLAAETGDRGIQLDFIKPGGIGAKPVSPNIAQVLMAAIGLGLVAGALSVFFAHRTDESFASGAELAKTFELPLLGTVSELISRQHRKARRVRNMILYPTNALLMVAALIAMAAILYLDLEKPDTLAGLKAKASWVFELPSAEASGNGPTIDPQEMD